MPKTDNISRPWQSSIEPYRDALEITAKQELGKTRCAFACIEGQNELVLVAEYPEAGLRISYVCTITASKFEKLEKAK